MNQLTNVYDIMKDTGRFSSVRHTGMYGVEVETETINSYTYPQLKYWKVKSDDSLRDFGVEYVLEAPISVDDLEKALSEIDACKKKYKFKTSSVSTSVHVHVNMLNSTYLTVANFLTAWLLVENALVRYSGPDRLSNLFCLPVCDCEGIVGHWVTLLKKVEQKAFKQLVNVTGSSEEANLRQKLKYSALNAVTLTTLGTLEVRTFRGETDTSIIQKWVEIIDKLFKFADNKDLDPVKILELYEEHGSNIVKLIFQEYADELNYPDLDKLIKKNVIYACKIATVSKDWSKFGIKKIKPIYLEKIKGDLDKISEAKFKKSFDQLAYHERQIVYEDYHLSNKDVRIVDASEDM